MPTILRFFKIYLPPSVLRKVGTFVIFILIGFILQDFLILFFITFIFAYLFLEVGEVLASKIHNWWKWWKKDKIHTIAEKYSKTNTLVTVLYIVFVILMVFVFANIIPKVWTEIGEFIKRAWDITKNTQSIVIRLETSMNLNLGLDKFVADILSTENIESFWKIIGEYIKNAGIILMKFFIALILSYIFILERAEIERFLKRIQWGNFSFFYEEWAIIAEKFWKGFGLIFRAQGMIALTNTVLTTIWLTIIGLVWVGGAFPYMITLALIVFVFGFVPVFGTFISSAPIIIIGYGLWGWPIVVAIIAMIAVVHAVEAYYLNPKIVSAYVHFPVFVTFVILILAEHFFWLIGLLIGIPVSIILIDLTHDIDRYIDDVRKRLQHG
jgi:predicted PurR-regulated permease PerM